MESEIKDLHQLSEALSSLRMIVYAGYLLNAFYQALILKKFSGETITPELEQQVKDEISRENLNILNRMTEGEWIWQASGKSRPS